jgi:hypothetical protein
MGIHQPVRPIRSVPEQFQQRKTPGCVAQAPYGGGAGCCPFALLVFWQIPRADRRRAMDRFSAHPTHHMHSTRRLSFRCMLGLAAAASLVACERAHVAPPARDSLRATVAAPAAVVSTPPITGMARTDSISLTEIARSPSFRPVDAVDSLFSRRFPAMLSSLLYQRWVSDTLSRDAYCQNEEADGYHVHTEWAVARIRLLSLGEVREPRPHEDNYLREVNAVVEVVRVGSLDSEPLDDAAAERHQPTTMSVGAKTDTLRLDWRRRDGMWERCGSEWAGLVTPVDLIGPPAATRKPGPEPLVLSPGASWDRIRALADSVGRAGPELVDARAASAAASARPAP